MSVGNASLVRWLCPTGDEFYIKEWPEVEGYTFREVLVSFPKATPIGVEEKATLNVLLNPQDDYLIQPGAAPNLSAAHTHQ